MPYDIKNQILFLMDFNQLMSLDDQDLDRSIIIDGVRLNSYDTNLANLRFIYSNRQWWSYNELQYISGIDYFNRKKGEILWQL